MSHLLPAGLTVRQLTPETARYQSMGGLGPTLATRCPSALLASRQRGREAASRLDPRQTTPARQNRAQR